MKCFAGGNLFSFLLFMFIYKYYDHLHCVLELNHPVTLYHCSNKYHNTMLFDLIAIEGAHCYLILESL
jgi:hypothetical protein